MFPKPVRREKEPKRLRQMSAKRAARVAAGEPFMPRSAMKHSPPRRLDSDDSDPGRRAFARAQACVGLAFIPGHRCRGENECSHLRDQTGAGLKEPDEFSCSMCRWLHAAWEEHRGPFAGWTKEQRAEWMRERCAETHALWLALQEERRAWWREVGAQTRRSA